MIRDLAQQAPAAGQVSAGRIIPNLGAVTAAGDLERMLGALFTVTLIVAVAVLVVCATTWAITSSSGHWQTAARARVGVWVALGGAAAAGGGLAWMDFLLDLGADL